MHTVAESILWHRRTNAFNALTTKPVSSVAALPCSDTRPGQRGMQHHVGWQAAELVWWQRLHEDLHATTQVLAELTWELHAATQVPA